MDTDEDVNFRYIKYLLEKEGVPLPESLLRGDILERIEITIKHPSLFSDTIRHLASTLKDRLPEKDLREFFYYLRKYDEFTEKYELSEDDIKIIKFLTKKTGNKMKYLLEMIGPFYFMGRIADEINKNEELPRIIVVTSFLYVFVSSYELLLHMIDRRLVYYLTEIEGSNSQLKNKKPVKNFMKQIDKREKKKEYMAHATAGELRDILGVILNEEIDNSIIGAKSKVKMLRNKISHINLFYDDKSDEIVIGMKKYTYEDLLEAYFTIFRFFIVWGKEILEINENFNEDKVISDLYANLKNMLNHMARFWKKVGRSGEMKRVYYNWVIKWTEEAMHS